LAPIPLARLSYTFGRRQPIELGRQVIEDKPPITGSGG
jgi:hypothetical protein